MTMTSVETTPRIAERCHCPHCGAAPRESVIRRGALTITADPDEIFWCGRRVPLSPTETHVFRAIAVRDRASNQAIDEALRAFGASAATRPVVLRRIRQKFIALGSEDPFARIGKQGVGLKADGAVDGAPMLIGLRLEPVLIADLLHR